MPLPQLQMPQINSPMEVAGKVMTLQNLLQQRQGNAMALQVNQMKLQQMQQDMEDEVTARQIMQKHGSLEKALPEIYTLLGPDKGAKLGKSLNEEAESRAKMTKAQVEQMLQGVAYLKTQASGILSLPEEQRPSAYEQAINRLPQESRAGLPAQYPGDGFLQSAEELLKRQAGELDLQIKRQDLAQEIQKTSGTEPIQPYQQAQLNKTDSSALIPGRDIPYPPEVEAQRTRMNAARAANPSGLTPAGLDLAARSYAFMGVLPGLGMGATKDKEAIINRAAEMYPNLSIASSKADFDSNRSSLVQLTKSMDAILAFERTTQKNLDLLLETAKAIPDTGRPWLNKPMRAIAEGALGNTELPAFRAAKMVDLTELSKIITNPNLTGVLTDEARREVTSLAPDNVTVKQLVAVAKVLRRDMNNRKTSLIEQRQAVTKRIENMLEGKEDSGASSTVHKKGEIKQYNGATYIFDGTQWVRK